MRLSIVIPVYNERQTLETVVERVRAAPLETEIILMDDPFMLAIGGIMASMKGSPTDTPDSGHPRKPRCGVAVT